MKQKAFFNRLLGTHLDFRVRLFNILAMTGVLVGVIMAAWGIVGELGAANILINLATTVISAALLFFATKSGRYQPCYYITIIIIFLGLFPFLFFTSGGNHSGMPSFFVFAVLFTIFMLEGKAATIMSAIELIAYSGVMFVAYRRPELVSAFETEADIVTDIWMGMLIASVSIGVCMFLHFRIYNRQQKELEAAREEALHLSEVKSSFLANMSHEIRTPINVILGMNEMILFESESPQIKDYSMSIQNAGKSLLFLIENILDIAKIESDKMTVLSEIYQTSDLINELSLIGTELTDKYELSFELESEKNLPRAFIGDRPRIRQIVSNFLSNAAKYTQEGSIKLSFGQKQLANRTLLCISVADTGIGIKNENIPHLLDAFTRIDLPMQRNVEGTGLGLAIAKDLAGLMGGRINIESEWGKGSCFSVEIPQIINDPAPMGERRKSARIEKKSGGFIAPGGCVLIVDDNEEGLKTTKALLSRTMLRVETASNGIECLAAARDFRYDVILMDYMMPDINGPETLRRLNELPGFDTPVIALTANVVAGTREKLLAAGFCEYLSKPVIWSNLEAALHTFLPPSLIMERNIFSKDSILPKQKSELSQVLSTCGVELANGLRYFDGDIAQYGKTAAFFTEHYEEQREKAEISVVKNDLETLAHITHTLKSRAKAVGAAELSDTASKLERLCGSGNEQIPLLMTVLLYEWKQVYDGLSVFIMRLDEILPAQDADYRQDSIPTFAEMLLYLRQNRRPDILSGIEYLIAAAETENSVDQLKEIRRLVFERSFREAERLFIEYMEHEYAEHLKCTEHIMHTNHTNHSEHADYTEYADYSECVDHPEHTESDENGG